MRVRAVHTTYQASTLCRPHLHTFFRPKTTTSIFSAVWVIKKTKQNKRKQKTGGKKIGSSVQSRVPPQCPFLGFHLHSGWHVRMMEEKGLSTSAFPSRGGLSSMQAIHWYIRIKEMSSITEMDFCLFVLCVRMYYLVLSW